MLGPLIHSPYFPLLGVVGGGLLGFYVSAQLRERDDKARVERFQAALAEARRRRERKLRWDGSDEDEQDKDTRFAERE